MSVTPARVLAARPVQVTEGQLDMFAEASPTPDITGGWPAELETTTEGTTDPAGDTR